VYNLETPHDFPIPHVDFLEHTIIYKVPQDKVGDLVAFDGSSTIDRTTGELSARCDLESHNVLTLNLDNDIVTGKKSVEQARKDFGEIVGQEAMGTKPAYTEGLQFQPQQMASAAFSDQSVIPGAPVRADDKDGEARLASSSDRMRDAEILATVIAIDRNEVNAALAAQKKKISQPVLDYAMMLNKEHGMNMDQTMKLGQHVTVKPVITPEVQAIEKKGAGQLASIITTDGNDFEKGYLDAMVKGHMEALQMLDNKLIKSARNDAVKQHLMETRQHVADHLDRAKSLQQNVNR